MPTRIVIDQDLGETDYVMADHCVILEDRPVIDDPETPGAKISVRQFVQWMNAHPEKRAGAGWDLAHQLPGDAEPLTRWQRLVRAIAALPDDNPDKIADLKE